MLYYSTNSPQLKVSFKEAMFQSMPPDRGLYVPEFIPRLDPLFLRNLPGFTLPELGVEMIAPFVGEEIPKADLKQICEEAFNFPAPVRLLEPGLGVLELFHGPSLAFKDFGARFMSRIMRYFHQQESDELLDVLVATSGDTGGAVALGFSGVPGTRVTILYPKGKVSSVQELQLTTQGGNVRALEIEGTFDDCQALVKQAFIDPDLRQRLQLTSANSINIARLLPQSIYYAYAYGQMRMQGVSDVVFVTPSGNFGNIAAGVLAWKMGVPVTQFVAATNVNDTIPRYMASGQYVPKTTIPTLSNAMDVSDPSNWVRIQDFFRREPPLASLSDKFTSYAFDDLETRDGIHQLQERYGYLACPHSAIAWLGAEKYGMEHPGTYARVLLSTAHPSKFPEVYAEHIHATLGVPPAMNSLTERKVEKCSLPADFQIFKRFLVEDKSEFWN